MAAQSTTNGSTRRLSEVARHVVIPTGVTTSGWKPVEDRCREFGDEFDEWQRGAGRVMLGKRDNGEYAATVGGITLSIPRQVAKTFLISRIIVALCTLFPGLTVLWTAHRTRTASMTFSNLRSLAQKPTVAVYVDKIRATNGEQEIVFKNGSRIMFGAREQGFGRGFDKVDIAVFDEAQILTEKALEDMVPATNQSRQAAGSLLFFMGTPPRPVDPGEAFKARRREALEIEAALAAGEDVQADAVYIECSADPDADPDDREQWAKANPSFPHRTPLRSMLRMRKNLPSDAAWMREALGVWDSDQEGARLVGEAEWAATATSEVPPEGVKTLGVAFSQDGSRYTLAGGLKHEDGFHVEAINGHDRMLEDGLGPLADWIAARKDQIAVTVISGRAGADALAMELGARGVSKRAIHVATTAEYCASCAMLHNQLVSGTVTHPPAADGDVLTASIGVVDKKLRGASGAWGWHATTLGGDETPVEAASLALWGARTTKRRPGRKQRRI